MEIYSFPPITSPTAKILILGSMPGKASLAANQYYAHPRNLFWPIMGELIGAYPQLEYLRRIRILQDNDIALWDVLKSCRRTSSLDADIEKSSMIVNDFSGFFAGHCQIRRVFFNGATAEQAFRKHVLPVINTEFLQLQRLPSSSPAHAAMSFQEKLQIWRNVIGKC